MSPRAVLFDFDFTLADPAGWLIPAWKYALDSIGASPPAVEALLKIVGLSLRIQYSLLTGGKAQSPEFENFKAHYARYRDENASAETRVFAGVEEMLSALYAHGIPLGIVSTGAARRLRDILASRNLLAFFAVIEAGCENKAKGIRRAAGRLSVSLSDVLYVGDHPEDCHAAVMAGTAFIAVSTGVHKRTDFPPQTIFISSVTSLVDLLGNKQA
jgi:phosphoglycolate phosphatase